MAALAGLEKSLEGVFKDVPHIPESGRKTLADIWPWLALIGGILQLLAAWGLWRLASYTSALYDYANSLSVAFTGKAVGPTSTDKMVIYLGVAVLAVEAVILLLAFPKLQKKQKAGWDLLFLGAVINVVYGVVQIFTYNRGIGSFVGSLIGSAIGFYLLFEVRSKFTAK